MDVVLFGAGGHAKVTIDIMRLNNYVVCAVLDDNKTVHGTDVMGIPVIGGKEKFDELLRQGITNMIITIGSNKIRSLIAERAKEAGFKLVNAVHPSSIISPTARVGDGVFIGPGAMICADAQIGDYAIINTGASVDHDCVIGDGVHVCPGVRLGGNVTVRDSAWVGIGSSVIQGITIGEHSMIGAGSVVVRDIPGYATAYGCPARVTKHQAVSSKMKEEKK